MAKNWVSNFKFLIVLKDKHVFPGVNFQPSIAGYFHLYFKDLGIYYWKKETLTIIFNKYKQSEVFQGKKLKSQGFINTTFLQPWMAGEFSNPLTKDKECRKRNICKIDLLHQKKLDHQLFLQIFSQVFEKQRKVGSFQSSFG